MNAEVAWMFPAVALVCISFALTLLSLWTAGKLAPWFLGQNCERPRLRSYFFSPSADMDLTKARAVTLLIALTLMLAALLAMAILVRLSGATLL